MTADLLSVWTDPDTAMEAVGTSLGILRGEPLAARGVMSSDSSLRDSLLGELYRLVDRGELETRRLADGRYAFRWRDHTDAAAVSTDLESARLTECLAAMRGPIWSVPGVGAGFAVETPLEPESEAPSVFAASPAPPRWSSWPRLVVPTAPLVMPAISCVLAVLAFVLLDRPVAIGIAVALALVGVVGLMRRVPFAGLWMAGVVIAALLLRLS